VALIKKSFNFIMFLLTDVYRVSWRELNDVNKHDKTFCFGDVGPSKDFGEQRKI